MNRIRILVCRVDDADPDHMTELAAFDLPSSTFIPEQTETMLDQVEAATLETGHLALRVALQAQWSAVDARLADANRQRFPAVQVRRGGSKPITVASRYGTVQFTRQGLVHPATGCYVMPGDVALPPTRAES